MGLPSSKEIQQNLLESLVEIKPHPRPLCYTDTRFCLPRNLILHFNCSEDDFTFTEKHINGSTIFFTCNGRDYNKCCFDSAEEKFLKDNVGATVLYMKRKVWR